MKSYSTTFHKPNVLSLDKFRMIWVIQIFLLHTHPSDSFLVRYLHFHVRHTILVSSFSRRGILTNQKHRRACDFTCSTFTASESKFSPLSLREKLVFSRTDHTGTTKVQNKVSSVGIQFSSIDESESLYIYFFLAVENQICIIYIMGLS